MRRFQKSGEQGTEVTDFSADVRGEGVCDKPREHLRTAGS